MDERLQCALDDERAKAQNDFDALNDSHTKLLQKVTSKANADAEMSLRLKSEVEDERTKAQREIDILNARHATLLREAKAKAEADAKQSLDAELEDKLD